MVARRRGNNLDLRCSLLDGCAGRLQADRYATDAFATAIYRQWPENYYEPLRGQMLP